MAKGVHNATSGYRPGKGKNGGGLPGQPSGKTKKQPYATRKGLSVQGRHKRAIAVQQLTAVAGVVGGQIIASKISTDPNARVIGRLAGGLAGQFAGNVTVHRTGLAIRPGEFRKLAKSEKAQIIKRNKTVARTQAAAIVGGYAVGAGRAYRQVTGSTMNMSRTRANSAAFRNAQSRGLGSIFTPKRGRGGVYNITSAAKPRRGYR